MFETEIGQVLTDADPPCTFAHKGYLGVNKQAQELEFFGITDRVFQITPVMGDVTILEFDVCGWGYPFHQTAKGGYKSPFKSVFAEIWIWHASTPLHYYCFWLLKQSFDTVNASPFL